MSLDKSYLHEDTYLIGLKEYYHISQQINKLPLTGEHADSEGSCAVRSLYFAAANGPFSRKRDRNAVVKLRLHNSLGARADLVVVKEANGVWYREQLPVSHEEAQRIISGDFSPMMVYSSDRAIQIYAFLMMETYRPDFMVECLRIAYEFPAYQARIVFKTNVRGGYDPMKFFEPDSCGIPVFPEEDVILKAEYDLSPPPFFRAWADYAGVEELDGSEYEYLRGRIKSAAEVSAGNRFHHGRE